MAESLEKLLSLLAEVKDKKTIEFVKSYKLWRVFFDKILTDQCYLDFYPLILNLELTVLCGLSESMVKKGKSFERFSEFMSLLSEEEKLFFALVINLKKKNIRAQEIWKQLNNGSGNDNLFNELMTISSNDDDTEQEEIENIINSYLDNSSYFQDAFNKRLVLLYGVRSMNVHLGTPVVGAMMASSGEIIKHYGEEKDTIFSKKYPDWKNAFFTLEYPISEFFIRAACRLNNIEPESISSSIEGYCNDKLLSRHARSSCKLIYTVKEKFKVLGNIKLIEK